MAAKIPSSRSPKYRSIKYRGMLVFSEINIITKPRGKASQTNFPKVFLSQRGYKGFWLFAPSASATNKSSGSLPCEEFFKINLPLPISQPKRTKPQAIANPNAPPTTLPVSETPMLKSNNDKGPLIIDRKSV